MKKIFAMLVLIFPLATFAADYSPRVLHMIGFGQGFNEGNFAAIACVRNRELFTREQIVECIIKTNSIDHDQAARAWFEKEYSK